MGCKKRAFRLHKKPHLVEFCGTYLANNMICKSTILPYFKEFCNPSMSCNICVSKLHKMVCKIEFYKPCCATLQKINKKRHSLHKNQTKQKKRERHSLKNNKWGLPIFESFCVPPFPVGWGGGGCPLERWIVTHKGPQTEVLDNLPDVVDASLVA
jgi:hypothetical protein